MGASGARTSATELLTHVDVNGRLNLYYLGTDGVLYRQAHADRRRWDSKTKI